MKCDRIDGTGSCGLVLLKHQVNSKQVVTEVRRKGVSHFAGIQAPRIPMGAADFCKKSFLHCLYGNIKTCMLFLLQSLCLCGWVVLILTC